MRSVTVVPTFLLACAAGGCLEEGPPPEPPPAPPVSPIVGEGVLGSDGSFGWRSEEVPDLQAELRRAQAAGCSVEIVGPSEWRGACSGVRVLARADATGLYRLCALGTDRGRCAEAWQAIRLAAPR
jgi:hypothetical protein